VNLSHVCAGENVGITQVGERVWLVTFMHDDLGSFDDETCRLEPIESSLRSERVTDVVGIDPSKMARPGGLKTCGSYFRPVFRLPPGPPGSSSPSRAERAVGVPSAFCPSNAIDRRPHSKRSTGRENTGSGFRYRGVAMNG
jgi:antitoxin (DNA-binding transcriptional repressor) of toxin-antitoxin stability system